MTFTDPDLQELDRLWPLGAKLSVPAAGTIVVAGAYEGRYCAYLSERFPTAQIFGYEPRPASFRKATSRLASNPNIKILQTALGVTDRARSIHGRMDGSSLIKVEGEQADVLEADAVTELPPSIDLLLLNMEGYEYILLPYLLNNLMHHRVKSMAIQFHPTYCSPAHQDRVIKHLLEYYQTAHWDPDWTYWTRLPIWELLTIL